MRELEYPFDSDYLLSNRKSLKRRLLKEREGEWQEQRIAVLGGSTTKNVLLMLELFLLQYGIKATFYESEYNRYYEDLMFPNPELESFAPDIIYIHTSNRNIHVLPVLSDTKETVDVKLQEVYKKFEEIWERAEEVYHCPIIQNNFELPLYRLMGNRDSWDYRGTENFITRLNQKLYDYATDHDSFYIHDIAYEASSYGLDKWSEPFYWHMYKYACCVPAIPFMSYQIANIIKSILGKNKKVLALDLDNTLWGGVIGDDGYENIEIGQETSLAQVFSEFQQYVKRQKELGIILAVISKNEVDVARKGFERPDSILKLEDFVSFKANWESKDRNLVSIAEELNLLPESFVFVDDNPAEREIIRQSVKGVAIPEILEPEQYLLTLDRAGYFEATEVSEEDRRRAEMYAANTRREELQSHCVDYGEYLDSLDMKAEIKDFSRIYMARIAQLINKSNQFNLTTRRYTQTEIEKIASNDRYISIYGKLADKFGDNGVVSIVIGEIKDKELHIDLWVMSCRVLKRDMEYAMMDAIISACIERKLEKIIGYYYPTKKNEMVRDFYSRQGFVKCKEDTEGNTEWEFVVGSDYEKKNSHIQVNGENADGK